MFKYFKQLHSSNKSHKLPITHCLSDQATVPQKAREFKQVQSLCLNLPKLARQRHSKGGMEKFALLIFLLQALEHSLFYTRMKILSSLVACLNASTCQVNCDSCLLHLPRDLKHMDFLLQSLHIWVQSQSFFSWSYLAAFRKSTLSIYKNFYNYTVTLIIMCKEKIFALPHLPQVISCFVINSEISISYSSLLMVFKTFHHVSLLITEISQCIWYLLLEK